MRRFLALGCAFLLLTGRFGTYHVCGGEPASWYDVLAHAKSIGNLPGAVLGALTIGLIQAWNDALPWMPGSDWTQSIVFSILILILVFRPEGLLGEKTPEGG